MSEGGILLGQHYAASLTRIRTDSNSHSNTYVELFRAAVNITSP